MKSNQSAPRIRDGARLNINNIHEKALVIVSPAGITVGGEMRQTLEKHWIVLSV